MKTLGRFLGWVIRVAGVAGRGQVGNAAHLPDRDRPSGFPDLVDPRTRRDRDYRP